MSEQLKQQQQYVLVTNDGQFLKAPTSKIPYMKAEDASLLTSDIQHAYITTKTYANTLAKLSKRKAFTPMKAHKTILLETDDVAVEAYIPILLANAFSAIIREWLTAAQLKQVNRLNDNGDNCASHNYCDANEAMVQAFQRVLGRDICFQSDQDTDFTDTAWDIAKRNHFQTYEPCDITA